MNSKLILGTIATIGLRSLVLSIEFLLQRLQETTLNKSSVVILMHDSPTKQITAEALPQVILYLREQGYEFKNFYEIIK